MFRCRHPRTAREDESLSWGDGERTRRGGEEEARRREGETSALGDLTGCPLTTLLPTSPLYSIGEATTSASSLQSCSCHP